MRSYVLLLSLLGLCAAETKFERCSSKTLGVLGINSASSKELCFKTVLKEVRVKIGPDGTNDDVTMEICSDQDVKQCCTTDVLAHTFKDDWDANDEEKWTDGKFGKCKNKVFTVKTGLRVSLNKAGSDTLKVTSLTIDTVSPDKKNKEEERFECGAFEFGKTNILGKQTKLCQTSPYKFMRINSATVKIARATGSGTNDDVLVKVCSDVNTANCCEKKLSHTFSDDWAVGKTEQWPASQFGKCAEKLFKVKRKPIVSVKKTGKDDLSVTSFDIKMEVIDLPKNRVVPYKCGDFKIEGKCSSSGDFCSDTLNCVATNAKDSVIGAAGIRTTTRKSIRVTTTKPKVTTTVTTTTKKKGLLGKLFG